MKKIKSFFVVVIMVVCGLGLPAFSHAGNRVITLPSSDGSDAFVIKNSEGVTLMTVFSNGHVGIGTLNPDAMLDLLFNSPTDENKASEFEWTGAGASNFDIVRNSTQNGRQIRTFRISGGNDFDVFDSFSLGMISNHPLRIITNNTERMHVTADGNIGIGTANPAQKLDVNGTARTKILEITGGSDLSEQFDIGEPVNLKDDVKMKDFGIEPGMVVCIDPTNPGKLLLSSRAYDRTVAGIISGGGGVNPGMLMGQKGTGADGEYPVALTGRVYCKADATYGSIQPGDILTTSETPGYAMKVDDYDKAHGAIIGKAMSSLSDGKGLVLTLISLQ